MKWRQTSSQETSPPSDGNTESSYKIDPLVCAPGATLATFLVNEQKLYTYYKTLGCLVQADIGSKTSMEKNFHLRKYKFSENKMKGIFQASCELHVHGSQMIVGSVSFCHDLPFKTQKSAQGLGEAWDLESPMTGKIIKYLVEPGQKVEQGQALVIIEAMKMENQIPSPASGTITDLAKAPGQPVQSGDRLLGLKS
jgi:biotin carboxyl carrier protein